MTTTTNSPKAQAEAMAGEIWSATPLNEMVEAFSTALEKLLTENEKAQKKVDQYFTGLIAAERAFQETKSQLTATEAKLEEAKKWLTHSLECPSARITEYNGSIVIEKGSRECTCGLDAILSTLTAAKKEEAK